ncbi:MAG TPA: GntR family transcriptional regulator [Rhodospirillales bacterium]|nr:GntR family transcriptional regulator [Rhodospirillales bacterium]
MPSIFKQAPDIQPRLAEDVYDQILSAIIDGQFAPGERLIQEKIATQINISRTPVREALLRLEQEGILELSGRKGFVIRQLSDNEVTELYGVREAIEGYAAFIVAGHRNPEKLAAIQAAVEAEYELSDRNLESEFRCNRHIHRTIVEQADNPVLLDFFDSIWGRSVSLWLFAATRTNPSQTDPDVHRQLLKVLQTGSPEEARTAMAGHVRDGLSQHHKNP